MSHSDTHFPHSDVKVILQMTIQPPHILLEGFPGWRMSTKGGEATGQRAMW